MKHVLTFTMAYFVFSFSCLNAADSEWLQFGGPTRNFQFQQPINLIPKAPTKRWQRTLGQGMSGVAVANGNVYTSYLVPFDEGKNERPESERTHREAIVALNADNGEVRWKCEYDAGWIESQQAFGGRSRAPQATPAICGDHVLSIGFTGIMHCLDQNSGKVIWKKNFVDEFKSIPVQFGFAASPLVVGDRVVVLAGGEGGGLVCLNSSTGETIWNVPCKEASYATPVLWDRPDGPQLVFVTRNRIVGVDADDGKTLWEYGLPEEGLTNVPTPLPINDVGLLISGQGTKGTRRIDIKKSNTGYEVTESWRSNEQFFYCNWVRREGLLFGCDGSLLLAIDVDSGKTVARFRGYKDANVLLAKEKLLIFHGDGHLSDLNLSDTKMKVMAKYFVLNERCWTPPTPSGNFLYCRGGNQLLCLDLVGGDQRAAVASARVGKSVLEIGPARDVLEDVGPLKKILTAFEKDGPKLARTVYDDLRARSPDAITIEERRQLVKLARGEGLHDFANLILKHVSEDFPEVDQPAKRPPSSETTRGDNGLLYVEFSIRNPSWQTIQAYVKGPEKHPFSYGLPLRPKQTRLEKWPVGTKLFQTHNGIRKDILLTVEEEFAGKTIEVPAKEANKE